MPYLIGTDEAGYGPNLGPLVIGATVWRVPAGVDGEDLYGRMPGVRRGQRRSGHDTPGLVIADSKLLYQPGTGLGSLERGVLAAVNVAGASAGRGDSISTWRALLSRCDAACMRSIDEIPWFASFDRALPIALAAAEVGAASSLLRHTLNEAGIELIAVHARVVFPAQFNQRVKSCGSKGSALTLWTLELARQLVAPVADGEIVIQCDKHGARNRYGALLQRVFPDYLIEVREESKPRSTYRWGPATRRVEAQFVAKGERFMPSALASMTAKYLRELAMVAFNEFWRSHLPGLRPTAGYPADAKRFRREIQVRQRQLGIADNMLWRER